MYSPLILWHGYRNFNIENSRSIRDIKVNFSDFKKQVWRYVRFKYLPYGYKQYARIEAMDFDSCRMDVGSVKNYHWSNRQAYDRIKQNPTLTKRDGNFFSFIHVEGSHIPFDMDKNLNRIQNGRYEQKVATSLTLVKAYLQRLKANNAYDNSVIIIMADHGYRIGAGMDYKMRNTRANPVLFIKGFKEKHEMKISDIPVSYYDLQQAFADLLEDKKSADLFAGIGHGRTRTFLSYKWDGSALRNEIVEFTTTGKAWEIDKFTPTGNVYTFKK